MNNPKTVEHYIDSFGGEAKARLEAIRAMIRVTVPDAEEGIMYGIAGYKVHGRPLVYFGAYSNHIGFYATPSGHSVFTEDLKPFKQGKGSVQFPLDQPLPIELIERIVRFRLSEVIDTLKKGV
jgi:uncharacterized protein YdhG (YjbR/CyaY superfamily)